MRCTTSIHATAVFCFSIFWRVVASSETCGASRDELDDVIYRDRIQMAKMDMWRRGAFAFSLGKGDDGVSPRTLADRLEVEARMMRRLSPIKKARRACSTTGACVADAQDHVPNGILRPRRQYKDLTKALSELRGGDVSTGDSNSYSVRLERKLEELAQLYGSEFREAIELNKVEHASDCAKSCELFYCGDDGANVDATKVNETLGGTTFASYSMGAVPPEDFAEEFGFPLDLIKVSEGSPLFDASEAADVVSVAEEEGLSGNEYRSGKYKLGGDWLANLPRTREWFNLRLETTFFPLLAQLFPEIIASPAVLRAHSVSLLKYNASHPRTDVHIDNGILAMTLAMTPREKYEGGGTFFEHMGVENILPMDVGHGTFRPGSVRHGGHRVTSGTRYILGAFLLLQDRVEHVRRLKNRGSDLRKNQDLEGAAKHFEWALAINPKCTTCLKDWAEVLHAQKQFAAAETKLRSALELLEDQDSDALFNLGMILSEQGRDEESIEAYSRSVALNAEDPELCYNLGIKLGARGDVKEEIAMYERATRLDPTMGGAFLNWGTALAESGDLDGAEDKFVQAIERSPEIRPKAMMNLALVHQSRANNLAGAGDLAGAKLSVLEAGKQLDTAKRLLDGIANKDEDALTYSAQFRPLRLQCHRLTGQILAAMQDFEACEAEFRIAIESFGDEPGAWEMLARVLEVQGKNDAAKQAKEKVQLLRSLQGALGPGSG